MNSEEWFQRIGAGDAEAVLDALQQHPEWIEQAGPGGVRPLLWALYHRQAALADRLAGHLDRPDVFELAALGRGEALAAHLHAQPADRERWSSDGFQPLHLAAFFARPETLQVLLQAGAAATQPARHPAGMHPLHSAAAARRADLVAALLAAGADPDARQQGGFTALMAAAMHGDAAMAAHLLAAGADPTLRSEDGRDAAAMARDAGFAELAQQLGG